jgi:carbon-monoxide dehydrogenase large subunit
MTVGERFVGQRVLRHEDPRFLTGRGRYVDDIPMPGVLHVAFARSDVARGRVGSVDTSEAVGMPGVVAVYADGDLEPLLHDHFTNDEILRPGNRPFRLFAGDDVRCVGEPIAMVVAASRYQAEDAVEAVVVEIDPADPIVDFARALDADAPIVHAGTESNLWQAVPPEQPTPELDAIIEAAPVALTETFHQHRYATVPMETRGVLANFEPHGEQLTVWISTQGPHNVRSFLARALALDESQIRVIMPDVGGAFGLKMNPCAEEIATILASRRLGRPVKWIQDRRENLMADDHAARCEGALSRRCRRVSSRALQRVGFLGDAVPGAVSDPRVCCFGTDGAHKHAGPRRLPRPLDDRDRGPRANDRLLGREARP